MLLHHDPNSSYSSQIYRLFKVQQNIKKGHFFLLIDISLCIAELYVEMI